VKQSRKKGTHPVKAVCNDQARAIVLTYDQDGTKRFSFVNLLLLTAPVISGDFGHPLREARKISFAGYSDIGAARSFRNSLRHLRGLNSKLKYLSAER
jgi:hypothetical protein